MENKLPDEDLLHLDSPHDREQHLGLRTLSVPDLLACALAETREEGIKIMPACINFIYSRGINRLGNLSNADIQELKMLNDDECLRLLAAIELGRRCGLSGKGQTRSIKRSRDIFELFKHLADEQKEHFCVVMLNSKNGILGVRTIHVGTVNMTVVGPREVFREAIREGASSIAVVHNHPSGDPTPSEEDFEITEKLVQIGEMLDIPVLDHVIIGHNTFSSFKELKYL